MPIPNVVPVQLQWPADGGGLFPIEQTVERWPFNPQHPPAFSPPPQASRAGPAWQPLPLPEPRSQNPPSQAFFDGAHDFHWEGDFQVDARQTVVGTQVNNNTYYNVQNPRAAPVGDLRDEVQQSAYNIGALKLLQHMSGKR
jgi:hypothetical protein